MFPHHAPSPSVLDAGMRQDLCSSLDYLHRTDSGLRQVADDRLARGLDEIRAHRVLPGLYGRYFDLVLALTAEDNGTAVGLLEEILDNASKEPKPFVLRFCAEDLGDNLERHARLVDAGSSTPGFLANPDDDEWEHFQSLVPSALDLVERADGALREEIDGLVAQVIAAVPRPEEGARSFGGVSSLMLWGAVTLNVRAHDSVIALAEGLVHETAHHLLFGLSRTEPLVENAIDESFASPLRKEPRPMDGVYHATFVCARIHYFYERLLKSDLLRGGERDRAERGVALNRERFLTGLDTVRAQARLTPNGRHVLAGAEAHIAGAA